MGCLLSSGEGANNGAKNNTEKHTAKQPMVQPNHADNRGNPNAVSNHDMRNSGAQQNMQSDQNVNKYAQKEANRAIEKDLDKLEKTQEFVFKLLLLGAGESGKSTLLRQMRRIHGQPFTEEEFREAKPHIIRNVIEAMRTLCIYSDFLADDGQNTQVKKDNEELRTQVAMMNDRQPFTPTEYAMFKRLWEDPGIEYTLNFAHRFQLIDTARYLFENMNKYCQPDYVPTYQDLVYSRHRTTGINKVEFTLRDKNGKVSEIYQVYDVGGQRNERRKWMHCFDNITAIIFVVALSGYNQTLWEDNRKNRMKESLALFQSIVNMEALKKSHIILFLNKSDLFAQKIQKHNIKDYFKDYDGPPYAYKEGIEYIQKKFADQRLDTTQLIYAHITCATDTSNVEKMFSSVRDIIVRKELVDGGFL